MSKEAHDGKLKWSDEVRRKVAELAELVALEKYGPEGPPLELTFSEIEALGHEVGRYTATTVDQTVQKQHAGHFDEPQRCPQCGRRCEVGEKERPLQTLDGTASLCEPVCDCGACKRPFFPSTSGVETGRPKL